MKIIQVNNYIEMSRVAANIISAQVILFPQSVLGLATGNTPVGMYQQLIKWNQKGDLDFSRIKTINLDEYVGLPERHNQSYHWFMYHHFFQSININIKNTFIPASLIEDPGTECKRYEQNIKNLGGIDLQVLGIGHNGHIGFNEPACVFTKNTHVVQLSEDTINANSRFFQKKEDVPKSAITMGMGTIMQSKRVVMLCSGKDKAGILKKALIGDIDPMIPASILQIHSNITVIADEAALRYMTKNNLVDYGYEVVTDTEMRKMNE